MCDDSQHPATEAGEPMPGEVREHLGAFMNIGSGGAKPGRPKSWEEATPDERIERLRDVIRSKDMAIQDLRQMVSALMSHTHGKRGELLGPIFAWGNQTISGGSSYDPLA